MKYTPKDVMDYVREEDIKFVRLAFCDVFGRQRNIAVMASELPRAFEDSSVRTISSHLSHSGGVGSSELPGLDRRCSGK